MKIILKLVLVIIMLSGCGVDKRYQPDNDNLTIQNKYSSDQINFDIFMIDYDDFEELIKDKYNGLILLSSSGYSFCVENFSTLVSVLNTNEDFRFYEILILETDELDDEPKKLITDEYGINFVPTTLIMEEGKIEEIVVGLLSTDQIIKIMKGN